MRGARLPKPRPQLEHEVQAAIVAALQSVGFRVKETTAYRQKGSSGVDKGIADLLVFHRVFQVGECLCIEVKRPGPIKFSSPEQELAYREDEFYVAQSVEEALIAARWYLMSVSARPYCYTDSSRMIQRIDNFLAEWRRGSR